MRYIARRPAYHHPFYRVYDQEADLQWRRSTYLIGAAAIQLTMILTVLLQCIPIEIMPIETLAPFLLEGFFLALFFYLRGIWIGADASQIMDKIVFGLGFLFIVEVILSMVAVLHFLVSFEPLT